MKKIIAMIITVAMLFALVTIGASADDGHYVWNHTGDFPDDPWNQTFRIGHDCPQTGTIRFKTDVSFSKVLFAKIWASAHAVVTLEVISDGNTVSTVNFELYNEENGSGDVPSVEVDLGKTLPAGEYTFKFSVPDGNYAFFAYGNDPLPDDYIDNERGHAMFGLWTTDSGSGFVSLGLVIEEKVVDVYKGSGDGGPQNLQGGAIAIVVTVPEGYTLAEIIGQNSPTWGKNDGGSDAQAEVYAWDGDYDSSVDGAVLATAEITDHADNADAVFAFENALPAGTYLIEFSSTGDMAIGFWSYGTAAGDPVVFVNGSETTAFYPKTAVKLVIAEPAGGETTDEPAGPVVHGASFDSFFVNDVLNFGQGDGAASSKLDAVNRTVNAEDGSVQ
ncbi:MAG: hypothetical protein J5950_02625, partial [Clostridia bacterium]|nr:hypothetical protein [Clostridia bacterium]